MNKLMNFFRIECRLFARKQGNPFSPFSSYFHSSNRTTKHSSNRTTKHSSNQTTKCRFGFQYIKNLYDALSCFDRMLRIEPVPSVRDYNKLLNIVVKMGRYSQPIALFKQMRLLGCPVDEYTMSIIINSYSNLKEAHLGFAVVATFLKLSFSPNIVTINCLIKGLFLQENTVDAIELFKKLIREKLSNVMVDKGMKPDVVTYGTIINGYCKIMKIEHALKVFKEMPLKGLRPDIAIYSCMMQGLFSVGRCWDALKLFNEMKLVGNIEDVYTNCIVLDGLFKNGKFEKAITFYEEVERKGLACHVGFYNIFIDGLCHNGMHDFARKVFHQISSRGLYPDVKTYTIMIKALCQEGLFQEAKKLLKEMEQSGCFPNNFTVSAIINGCVKHCGSDDSIDLLRQIADMKVIDEDLEMRSFIQKLISNDKKSLEYYVSLNTYPRS